MTPTPLELRFLAGVAEDLRSLIFDLCVRAAPTMVCDGVRVVLTSKFSEEAWKAGRQFIKQVVAPQCCVSIFYAHCADDHEAGRVYKDLPELLQRTGVVQEPGSRSDASNGWSRLQTFPSLALRLVVLGGHTLKLR